MQITHRAISSTLVPSFRFSPERSLFLTRFGPPSPSPRVREFSWLAELMAFGKIGSYPHRVAATSPGRSLCRKPVLHLARSFYNEEIRIQSCQVSSERCTTTISSSFSSSSLIAPSWITRSLPLLEPIRIYAWPADVRRPSRDLSLMSIYGGSRGRKRREIGTSAEKSLHAGFMNVENRKGCCGLECPLLGRPSTLRNVGVPPPPPSASIYLFFSLPFGLSLPLPSLRWGSPSSSSVHFRALALSSFLLAALRDIWIVGSHLPHYHTNRPLTHSDAAFILCPSHLRLAGDQPKSGLVHDQSLERADRESYELAREPLAWGTRRKSIILNHGMIGSNDQTTARRMSRFARTCHVASVQGSCFSVDLYDL